MRGMDNANIMSSDDQPTTLPPVASKVDTVRKDGNNNHVIIDPAADDINQTTPSPDHFDSSGHPLSEYERLRLRNIQRNNSRLDQLGLSAIARPKHADMKPKGSGDSNKARSNNMRPSAKRTNPRRTTTTTLSLPEVSGKGTATNDTASTFAPSTSASAGGGRKSDPKGRNNTDEPKDTIPKAPQLLPRGQNDSNMLLERGENAELSIMRGRDTLANAGSTHQPTPSPLHHPQGKKSVTAMRGKNPPQIPALPPPPSWIKDFISEPIEMVPIPRGSKWLPCGNPWGKVGHEDDDVVIVSPFQSETMNDILLLTNIHQEMPKRFVSNPLELGSPYRATHCSPARGGYSVLRLRRDRSCLRPWGFTARLHEFGGACLIDSIEPLSPAEAAVSTYLVTSQTISALASIHSRLFCS